MRRCRLITLISAAVLAAAGIAVSCSTTRVLADGEYRLAKNKIVVDNDKKFNGRSLMPYLGQQANSYFVFGWNPFLNVYNWQNGKGKGWDKFVTKIGVAPVVYEPDLVTTSEESIKKHLEYLGYFNSDVTGTVGVKKRRAYVTYNVNLGKQYPIKSFDWDVPEGRFEEVFNRDTASITVHPGMPLSEASLEEETVRSTKWFRENGFYTFSKENFFFEADTLTCPDSAILQMSIREYTRGGTPEEARPLRQFSFNDVSISHPAGLKFREKVLKDMNTITPGELYRESSVSNTYSRLSALRVFNGVNVELTPAGDTLVDCNIRLSQSKVQGFKVNLEASVNSTGLFGLSPQLSYYHKNIFHGGEWLNVGFMGNFQFKFKDKVSSQEFGVSAGLSFPRFLGLPMSRFENSAAVPRTDINVSYNFQNRPEYRRNIISASYGYTGTYRKKFSYQVYPVQLSVIRLSKLDESFYESLSKDPFMRNSYQNHFDLGGGGTLFFTTDPTPNPQTSYFYSRLQFDISGNLISAFKPLMKKDENGAGLLWKTPFSQFVRGELTLAKAWRMGRNDGHCIAVRLLAGAGYAYGNSSALPFEKHFYGGGASSLRGWQARSVGPGLEKPDENFIIPNQTGDMKLEANLEYRVDLFWKLEGALFVDAGNVWTIQDKNSGSTPSEGAISGANFGKSIAMDWGIGLRVDFNFLVVRLDWGMRIHDPAREQRWVNPSDWVRKNGYALHFGVGYPF